MGVYSSLVGELGGILGRIKDTLYKDISTTLTGWFSMRVLSICGALTLSYHSVAFFIIYKGLWYFLKDYNWRFNTKDKNE